MLDLVICSKYGKGQSELGMLRQLRDLLRPGDIMLVDRYLCGWHEIYLLKQRGIDMVTRLHHCRRVDFRRGKRLGKGDHVFEWRRPGHIRSIDWQTLKSLPERITIRETRERIQQPGFRCRSMIVVSTLLDAEAVTASDLADLYRRRWNADLDLRSLKQTMEAFRPLTAALGDREWAHRLHLYQQLLNAVATHRVADRPDRIEPQQRKGRQKKYDRMMKPRSELKHEMLNGVT